MSLRRTRAENLALTMLARDGIAAIWVLHLAAARADREGQKAMAAGIVEIAEAAETRARPPCFRAGEDRISSEPYSAAAPGGV
jgi:hypothetical protein